MSNDYQVFNDDYLSYIKCDGFFQHDGYFQRDRFQWKWIHFQKLVFKNIQNHFISMNKEIFLVKFTLYPLLIKFNVHFQILVEEMNWLSLTSLL